MWGHMWDGTWWPWGLMMGLFWLVLFGLVIFLGVYLARQWSNERQMAGGPPSGPESTRRETPKDVLDRRYAEGEISREEYQQMKADLDEPD